MPNLRQQAYLAILMDLHSATASRHVDLDRQEGRTLQTELQIAILVGALHINSRPAAQCHIAEASDR